jgi:hypothetical protein
MTFMSAASGLWFLRIMAAKNCASEGYTHVLELSLGMLEEVRSVERAGVWVGGGGRASEGRFEKKFSHDERGECSTGHLSVDVEAGVLCSTGQCADLSTGHCPDMIGAQSCHG